MGWLWATPSPPRTPAPADSASASASASTSAQPQDAPAAQPSNNNMDPEIEKFLSLIQAETGSAPDNKPSKPTSQSQPAPAASQPETSSTSSWFSMKSSPTSSSQIDASRAANPAPKLDPVAEALLPTDMSCRQAFDMAFHCQSVGGQWNAVYRGGGMRSCSEQWDDFWFCMRVKGYAGEMREEAIREHYRNKEWAKYGNGRPSSEDVWKPRISKVAPGTAFTTPLEAPTVSDEEWQQAEIERRRQLRQKLGYDQEATA
ncbi:hypothetical protein B0T11DRAFT_291889 [Plectosphaerella cucumerina]|uniref:Early meiotic induction protein 1 n=1 Tax=Plectosphaerella cucumerina TaxID=40658 RepID=A0A8K0WY53_9PEZI|nr:hypothetical protein B0T11DRAFT_291889 [Plectosphaerella cucumerina]